MASRCRVCHRELTNPAHIAAGVGPVCAQRAARFGVGTGVEQAPAVAAYPAERMARIERALRQCAKVIEGMQAYRAAAYSIGTPEQQAEGDWRVRLAIHWYGRWKLMQIRAQRMVISAQAAR